jgi:hypothetical protein
MDLLSPVLHYMETAIDHHVRRKELEAVLIPPDLHSKPNIVSLATRLKMTPTHQAAFTQGLISESGGDVLMVASLYATADRSRRKVTGEIAQNIKDQWKTPKLCTLHWDGKLTATLENHLLTEERTTVIVGDVSQTKLLGVPSYKKGTDQTTGSIIADLTVLTSVMWHQQLQVCRSLQPCCNGTSCIAGLADKSECDNQLLLHHHCRELV